MNVSQHSRALIKELVTPPEGLEIREELIGYHACNPFIPQTSSPRGYMMSAHHSQRLTINNGEEKIIQTGLEYQFGKNTFSSKTDDDYSVINIINRYNSNSNDCCSELVDKIIIVENLRTGEIDYLEVPLAFTTSSTMGFTYKWNTEVLKHLEKGSVIPSGVILADSPGVGQDGGYKHGINANMALITIPEIAEDGVVISQSMADRLVYDIYEKKVIEFGSDSFPLNIYGDENNYKPFPSIGEGIGDHSIIMAVRDYDDTIAPALLSKSSTMSYDPTFDKCFYVKAPYHQFQANGVTYDSGVVVDIKAYKNNSKRKKYALIGTTGEVDKYVNGMIKYHKDILETYEKLRKNYFSKYGTNDLPISNKFHRLIMDSIVIANPDNLPIKLSARNKETDIYRIEFTIRYSIRANIGNKISDSYGAKGVIVSILPDDEMPVSVNGVRADIIMDPISIISRMNIGRLYDMYIAGASRKAKTTITSYFNSKEEIFTAHPSRIEDAWHHVLSFLSYLETEQFTAYSNITNVEDKREILADIIYNEFYTLYKLSTKKKPIEIVLDLFSSAYGTDKCKVWLNKNGNKVLSKEDIMIAPLFIILLCRTADDFLSVASSKVNHYGIPISVGSMEKELNPWKPSPTKNLSETDARVYVSYAGREAMAELKDRANSRNSHKEIYKNILSADKPTNIDMVIDRNRYQYGSDESIKLVDYIYNSLGIDIIHMKGQQ